MASERRRTTERGKSSSGRLVIPVVIAALVVGILIAKPWNRTTPAVDHSVRPTAPAEKKATPAPTTPAEQRRESKPTTPVERPVAEVKANPEAPSFSEAPAKVEAPANAPAVKRTWVDPDYDVAGWAKTYATRPTDPKAWCARYRDGVYSSWFGEDNAECAKGYLITWGPLGIRTRMHDQTWGTYPAFRALYPKVLTDSDGELVTNTFEVLKVLPGSPAEGHLEEGDLLLAMDGQPFLPAQVLHPDTPYQFQDRRSLEMHAGEMLDLAESDGKVTFHVLRLPKEGLQAPVVPSGWQTVAEKTMMDRASRDAGFDLQVPVRGGQHLRLIVDDGGNGKHADGFDWRNLRFEREGKTVPLWKLVAMRKETGWASVKVDEATGDWWVHAYSILEFQVPGGAWTLRGRGEPNANATVHARIDVRFPPALPREVEARCKDITFNIQKIGTFAEGFPSGCHKSANIVAMEAAWLAAQQNSDGSWPRPSGYTSNHYDTAWAALGLMATGDPAYDPRIARAANYVAFSGTQDGWAVPGACCLLFLSEYWLRYHDDRVLPAIQVWAQRLIDESVQGDMTAGHGHNPGYRGTGVSIGGSHVALALTVANLTPVDIDDEIVKGMLFRAQELAPDGHIPYGRGREQVAFEPNLETGATYSGRHGPYLIASMIYGGPKLFTENCTAMYTKGPVGSADQGHATQTLSMQWAFPALAVVSHPAYQRHFEALKWKLTMLRCYDGGFCHNAYRLEYQGGESLLDYALRCGGWLVSLCAERHNLAMTGAPQYRAAHLTDVPPTTHRDATLLGYYLRNWAVAEAALGDRAPTRLRDGVAKLAKMDRGRDLHARLFAFLEADAPAVARELLAAKAIDERLRQYCAEMVLGIDQRITVVIAKENDKEVPGRYEVSLTTQHSFAGRCMQEPKETVDSWTTALKLPLSGTVEFLDPEKKLEKPVSFTIDPKQKVHWNDWHNADQGVTVNGPREPFQIAARIRYTAGDLHFDYTRPILVNQGEEWGNGEKQRPVTNDRQVWVPGTLIEDHTRWEISFHTPSGLFIAAATQGNEIRVTADGRSWIAPNDQTLLAGSECVFCFTSGWQGFEARVPEVRLKESGTPEIRPDEISFQPAATTGDVKVLADGNPASECVVAWPTPDAAVAPGIQIDLKLPAEQTVRALDLRAPHSRMKIVVKAWVGDDWKDIYWGQTGVVIHELVPTKTAKLRVQLTRENDREKDVRIGELRIF